MNIQTRHDLEQYEEAHLAPYAMRAADTHGRVHPETEHPYRSAYQRDRDRVVHSSAFRRLEYKTQVFVNQAGDYYRTRLTHTMEVSQISRTIARALRLNEDLTEVIALGHDLGHTPFGHAGEGILNELMAGNGGFNHNVQVLRVVDLLEERYPDFLGLNLTREVRESLIKRSRGSYDRSSTEFSDRGQPLLEAQVVDLADSTAYDNHDIDDGLRAGLFAESDLQDLELWKLAVAEVFNRYPKISGRLLPRQAILNLINLEVTDLINHSLERINDLNLASPVDCHKLKDYVLAFSPEMARMRAALQRFLHQRMYGHHLVRRMQKKAHRILAAIFEEFATTPELMPEHFQHWAGEVGVERGVCDYIAGMTDRHAQEEYAKLFFPDQKL